jgi:capsular polysaccharide biosynthesis protein
MFINITYESSDAKMAQVIANAIGQVVSQMSSEVSLGESRITTTLWKPAMLPRTPASPKPLRNGLLTLVVGLALVASLAWAVARRS